MARIFIDGFESGGLECWSVTGTATTATGVSSMSGTYCAYISTAGAFFGKTLSTSYSDIYIKFRYRPTGSSSVVVIIFYDSASTKIGTLKRDTATGTLTARIGNVNGTVLGTGSESLSINNTYLVEIRYKPHNSAGYFQVKINGTTDIDVSGVDTTAGLENIQTITFGYDNSIGIQGYGYYDDVVLDDANWIGNTVIQKLSPSGAGNSTQLTASTGSNYGCVDEIPYSDTDYVYGNTTNYLDTYAMSDLAGSVASIQCVQVQARAVKYGSPTPTTAQLVVRTNSTDYTSSSKTLSTITPGEIYNIWETNPATSSSAWTTTAVNGLETGVKLTA